MIIATNNHHLVKSIHSSFIDFKFIITGAPWALKFSFYSLKKIDLLNVEAIDNSYKEKGLSISTHYLSKKKKK